MKTPLTLDINEFLISNHFWIIKQGCTTSDAPKYMDFIQNCIWELGQLKVISCKSI